MNLLAIHYQLKILSCQSEPVLLPNICVKLGYTQGFK